MKGKERNDLNWAVEGETWPNRAASRFVEAGGIKWHVQVAGEGPVLLLLHGTASSTHSWRDLLPLLAEDFTVLAPDFPDHGFTLAQVGYKPDMASFALSITSLLRKLELWPELAVGHSAGAAVALRMAIDGLESAQRLKGVVGVNAALRPFQGAPGKLFPSMARLLFANPVTPRLFAWGASDLSRVERLIRGSGSTIDAESLALYQRLMRSQTHIAGALGMMAHWDLDRFEQRLGEVKLPLLLLAGDKDLAVPPSDAKVVEGLVPTATRKLLPNLGHLAHEEDPGQIASLIKDFAVQVR